MHIDLTIIEGKNFAAMKSLSRRSLVGGALAGGAALGREAFASDSRVPQVDSARKLKIIVTGGHPGDPEYGCGGTVVRYTDLGHEVFLLYLNRGRMAPQAAPEAGASRMAEATRACEILKARPLFAGQLNGRAIVDQSRYETFRKLLEAQRPDVGLHPMAHRQPCGPSRHFHAHV